MLTPFAWYPKAYRTVGSCINRPRLGVRLRAIQTIPANNARSERSTSWGKLAPVCVSSTIPPHVHFQPCHRVHRTKNYSRGASENKTANFSDKRGRLLFRTRGSSCLPVTPHRAPAAYILWSYSLCIFSLHPSVAQQMEYAGTKLIADLP